MPKDDAVYVAHMLETARRALRIVEGKRSVDFFADETLRLALTRLVQVIGEAARRVSVGFVQTHPEVPWKAVTGMRNKLVHDYMGVDEDMIWDTVTKELPSLVTALDRLVR